jgi:hypothetical protein
MFQLLVTANIVPSLLVLSTLMMEAILSLEMSVLTRAMHDHIPEDGIIHHVISLVHVKMSKFMIAGRVLMMNEGSPSKQH